MSNLPEEPVGEPNADEVAPSEDTGLTSSGNNLSANPANRRKVKGIFEQFEMMALNKGREGVDLSHFSDEQKTRLLSMLEKGEDNAFNYHMKKLDVDSKIKLRRIDSKTVEQKTDRYTRIGVLSIGFIITLCILFFKDNYFGEWIAFIAGGAGVYGISNYQKNKTSTAEAETPPSEEE